MRDGVLVVDKPAGISSAGIVAKIKKMTGATKAGHCGTLDPFATGVLVCCLNSATRLSRFLLEGEKVYRALLCLGIETDTQDVTGKVLQECEVPLISKSEIASVFSDFIGEIWQTPPAFSALKHRGKPLYEYARKGEKIIKPDRKIEIRNITVLKVNLPEILFEVRCSAGTYVRTLCDDMGKRFGCGGVLKALRRTASSGFSITEAASLEEIEILAGRGKIEQILIDNRTALKQVPEVLIDEAFAKRIRQGQKVTQLCFNRDIPDGVFKVINDRRQLVAVLKKNSGDSIEYCCVFGSGTV